MEIELAKAMSTAIIAALGPSLDRRCPQCWKVYPMSTFMTERGRVIKLCPRCRERYPNWSVLSLEERAHVAGSKHPSTELTGRISFTLTSGNAKTGPIPVSMSEPGTCPTACAFYDTGCYALYGKLSSSWRRIATRGGMAWRDFLAQVAALPDKQIWRHNQAGDLAGAGDAIDVAALKALTRANIGKRGFTFTHKPMLVESMLSTFQTQTQMRKESKFPRSLIERNRAAVREANSNGFTINLSADSLEHADALAALKIAPVTVVLPEDAARRSTTPSGKLVIVCPAQVETLTCETCGLCAKPQRKAIIGFRAHGQFRSLVSEIVRSKRSEVTLPLRFSPKKETNESIRP